jgi:SAM-dependent methyltransferase
MSEDKSKELFSHQPEIYDAIVDWQKRLGKEGPFYQQVFEKVGVRKVLDTACGTGRHALMFQSWGMEVEAADSSEAMIDYARRQHGESASLKWVVRPFDQPVDRPGEFDAVICSGNSLPLARDKKTIQRAVCCMLEALRSGGVCIIHLFNLWHLEEGPTTWQKCLRGRWGDVEQVLLKGIHRCGDHGYVNFIRLAVDGDRLESAFEPSVLVALKADELSGWVRQAGAKSVDLYGDYSRNSYDPLNSNDMILVCWKK